MILQIPSAIYLFFKPIKLDTYSEIHFDLVIFKLWDTYVDNELNSVQMKGKLDGSLVDSCMSTDL